MKENKKVDLLDVATTFARRKVTILKIVGIVTVLGIIVAFIWPKSYKTEVSFVVSNNSAINLSAGGLIGGLAGISTGGSKITSDQALVVIRSTAIQDRVIDKFNLSEVYGTDIPEALRKSLDNNIEVEDIREGGIGFNNIIAIKMAYTDKDPQRSYELVQYYYQLMDSTIQALNKQNVEESFLMIEKRLEQNLADLKVAEDSLVSFQSRHGILEVEEQAKAQIKTIADVRAEIVQLEIQLDYLSDIVGQSSSQVADLKVQKNALERRYNQLVKGDAQSDGEFSLFQSAEELPALFVEYLRRYREVLVQEEVYKVLYPQYEQQRMSYEEAISGLLLIDPPVFPTYKDSPKRAYIMIASFIFGLFLAVLIIFYKEWRDDLKENDPEEYKRFKTFTAALRFRNDKG